VLLADLNVMGTRAIEVQSTQMWIGIAERACREERRHPTAVEEKVTRPVDRQVER
jgi:hypothetical protein